MALNKAIRGLTIEIGGDTTKLSKAIGGIDSQLNGTQAKLKDVNKLLKMDPSNVTLLTQKQKDLESAISSTSDRLKALKSVQTDSLSPDAYDALQREIIERTGQGFHIGHYPYRNMGCRLTDTAFGSYQFPEDAGPVAQDARQGTGPAQD